MIFRKRNITPVGEAPQYEWVSTLRGYTIVVSYKDNYTYRIEKQGYAVYDSKTEDLSFESLDKVEIHFKAHLVKIGVLKSSNTIKYNNNEINKEIIKNLVKLVKDNPDLEELKSIRTILIKYNITEN